MNIKLNINKVKRRYPTVTVRSFQTTSRRIIMAINNIVRQFPEQIKDSELSVSTIENEHVIRLNLSFNRIIESFDISVSLSLNK